MEYSKAIRRKSLHDGSPDLDVMRLTPEERMAMVWSLTVFAWEVAGLPVGGPMRKDVVRMFKRVDGKLVPCRAPADEASP